MDNPLKKIDNVTKTYLQNSLKDIGKTPANAVQGENDVISQAQPQQQQQSMPSMGEVKGEWKQHVGSAKIAWGELTEDELLQTEGHVDKLAGLVQERYAITLDEAEKQVKGFIDTHKL